MKSTLKRFLSLVLCMCMVMALLPNVTMTAFAATSGTVTGLSRREHWPELYGRRQMMLGRPTVRALSGAATSTGGTCGDTAYNSTLTITNKKSTTATLSFDYAIEQNERNDSGGLVQRFLRVPVLLRNWRQTRALKYTSSLAAPAPPLRSPLPTWFW